MRCLVTGGAGFVGSYLVRELLARNHDVVVLLRAPEKAFRLIGVLDQLSVVRGSLQNLDALKQALGARPVDVAYHLAWSGITAAFRNSTDSAIDNISGSLHLWQLLRNTGCKAMITAGSQAEYGLCSEVIHEDTPRKPVTLYGASKSALCDLFMSLSAVEGMRSSWVRLFSVYGPSDNEKHMLPSVIRALLRGERPALTKGEQIWDFLYVADAAKAIYLLGANRVDGVFNLASGQPLRLREVIETVRNQINADLSLSFGEVFYSPDQVMCLLADTSRLQKAIGWEPEVDLFDGIRRTIDFYKQ